MSCTRSHNDLQRKKVIATPTVIVIKSVNKVFTAGNDEALNEFLMTIDYKFKLGTVKHGPRKLGFIEMNVAQLEDISYQIDSNHKGNALEGYQVAHDHHNKIDEELDTIEKHAIMPFNASIRNLGKTSLPLCAFYTSR